MSITQNLLVIRREMCPREAANGYLLPLPPNEALCPHGRRDLVTWIRHMAPVYGFAVSLLKPGIIFYCFVQYDAGVGGGFKN